jgi:membrane fusion protein (multidrug efflux system)
MLSGCAPETRVEKNEHAATNVSVLRLEPQNLEDTWTFGGVIEASKDIIPASELGGGVEWIGVREGDSLEKGQEIAHVNLEMLETALDQANARFHLAEVQHRRQKTLFEKKLISAGQMDRFEADLRIARANARAARVRFEKGKIVSPVSGILNRLDIDVGEVIAPARPIGHIVRLDEVKAVVSFPEKDLPFIQEKKSVEIRLLSHPGWTFRGEIDFIAAAAEKQGRTFRVEVLVPNPEHRLRPGMIVDAVFPKPVRKNVILVPQTAVLSKEGRKWVFVEENGAAREREIETGARSGTEIEVLEGLETGDLLVVLGQHNLMDGDPVHVARKENIEKERPQ